MRQASYLVLWLVATLMLASCAAPPAPPAKPRSIPVFPAPPEPARFIYERSIYSSADVVADSKQDEFRRLVTGETKIGEGLSKPYAIAVQRQRIYVGDTVRRTVMVFDLPAKRFYQIGLEDPGSLRLPLGLDIDSAGNLYVCDATLKRILIYDASGKFLRQIGSPEQLRRPSGLAVEPSGERVYVVDTGGVDTQEHRVAVLDAKSGEHLMDIGKRGTGPGEFNLPRDVAVAPNGLLYVVDGGNFRVQVFNRDGSFVSAFGSVGRQGGQFSRPKEIGIDKSGNVYIVDAAFGNFQVFTSDGQLLLDVGSRANSDEPAKFMLPAGIAIDEDGRVYVVDQFFRKVEVFRPVGP